MYIYTCVCENVKITLIIGQWYSHIISGYMVRYV